MDKKLEKGLIKQSKSGDKEAFSELVAEYQSKAYVLAYEILRNSEEARDVVQESFVKAYLALKTFKEESSFYTWLFRIVRNMSIDVKRKKARRGGDHLELNEQLLDSSKSPEKEYLQSESRNIINQIFNQLSEEHRVVLRLKDIDGLSYADIAKILKINKGTVMSRIYYARSEFKKLWKNTCEMEEPVVVLSERVK